MRIFNLLAISILFSTGAAAADGLQTGDVFSVGESGWAVMPASGQWDGVAGQIGGPYVVYGGRAGYATSQDAVTWSRPIFATNRRGDTLDVAEAAVAAGTVYLRLVDGTVTRADGGGARGVVAVGVSRLAPVGSGALVLESGRGLELAVRGVVTATVPNEQLIAICGEVVVGSGGSVLSAGGGPVRKIAVRGQRAAGGGLMVITSAPATWRDDSAQSWRIEGGALKAIDSPGLRLTCWGAGAPRGSGGGEWAGIGLVGGTEICGEDARGSLKMITKLVPELGSVRGLTSMGRDASGRLRVLVVGSAGIAQWRER